MFMHVVRTDFGYCVVYWIMLYLDYFRTQPLKLFQEEEKEEEEDTDEPVWKKQKI